MTMRAALFALTLFAAAAAACGGGGGSGGGPEIRVTLSDYAFVPATIEIPAGTAARLVAKNTGSVEHDFTVDKVGYKLLSPTGREVSKSIGPLQAGTYEVTCSVAGHVELGMKATLVVK